MKFLNPVSGDVYSAESLPLCCPTKKRSCTECPVGSNNNGTGDFCDVFIQDHLIQSANLEESALLENFDAERAPDEDGKDTNVPTKEEDMVNHPSHYTQGGIECIDALTAMITPYEDPNDAALSWQVVKYIWRHPFKHKPLEDLKKARFYLERLIKHQEEKETGDAV